MIEELYSKYVGTGYRVTTDSRAISGGEMFFALRGENFDGNDYALKAIEAGAAWAVVNGDSGLPENPKLIKVADPFRELQELAVYHRLHVLGDKRLPVIGLTGTNGKTTTKELIREVLATKYRVTATEGNLNNDIGVPLSILKITPETEIAVIEMGANHHDDIAKLVKVSQPDYGLITNVGKAHLLGFGSFEGVKAAKGELYKWLGSHMGSVIFLNEDDADLRKMAASQPCHTFGYGIGHQGVELLPTDAEHPFVRLQIPASDGTDREIRTNLVGAYNANNVLAALAVGEYFGVPFEDGAKAVEAYLPKNNRSQLMRSGTNTLIVDAYNANPSSMAVAVANFAEFRSERKLALLGDMRELGEDSVKEHITIVRKLADAGLDSCLVGTEFRKALDQLATEECAVSASVKWFATSEDLASWLSSQEFSETAFLVKGSRGIRMENVLKVL